MLEQLPLTVNEALSGIAGSISLACWTFLLVKKTLVRRKLCTVVADSDRYHN